MGVSLLPIVEGEQGPFSFLEETLWFRRTLLKLAWLSHVRDKGDF